MPRGAAWDRMRERIRTEGEYNPPPMRRAPSRSEAGETLEVSTGIYGVSGLGDWLWGASFPMTKEELEDYVHEGDCVFYNGACFELTGILEEIPDRTYQGLADVDREIARYIESTGIAETEGEEKVTFTAWERPRRVSPEPEEERGGPRISIRGTPRTYESTRY